MAAQRKYPGELRERATRLVLEARVAGDRDRTACSRIGAQLGIPSDTLRGNVLFVAEVDASEGLGGFLGL